MHKALVAVLPLLLATLTTLGLATPAEAAPGRCAPGTGVTVVVDFHSLGGGVQLGCDSSGGGKQASQVVPRAGFPLTYLTTGQPFVCRIKGLPTPAKEPCNATPPEDAFWALYWSNGRDGKWIFAGSGVATLKVPEGGSIGWRWRDSDAGGAPGAPPTTGAPPKPEPTKPEPTKPAPEPTKAPVTPTQSASPTASASAGTPSGSPTAATKAERAQKRADERAEKRADDRAGKRADRQAAAKAERRAEREADSEATGDEQVTAEGVAQEETPLAPTSATDDGGSGLTWVAGGAVLLLAAAAGVLARRRRG